MRKFARWLRKGDGGQVLDQLEGVGIVIQYVAPRQLLSVGSSADGVGIDQRKEASDPGPS